MAFEHLDGSFMGSVGRYIASVGSGKFQDDECVWRAFPDLLPGGERGLETPVSMIFVGQ